MELYKTFDHEWGHSLGSTFRNISIPSLFGYSYQFLKRDIYLKNTMDNIFLQLSVGQIFWQLVGNDKRMTGKYEMKETYPLWSVQFSSVTQSCLTLCDSMDCSTPGFLVLTNFRSLHKLMSIELVMPSSHLILCRLLLLLPSIFPSIRVFSNESVLRIRWPKY